MAFFGRFWWFVLCAVGDGLAGFCAARRYVDGLAAGHRAVWQLSRVLVSAGCFLAGLDCLRLFAGGLWGAARSLPSQLELHLAPAVEGVGASVSRSSAPLFAYSIYPLMLVHLVLVPLLMIPNTEFEIAARTQRAYDSGEPMHSEGPVEQGLRWLVCAVAVLLALVGLQTVLQQWRATSAVGLRRAEQWGGVVTWRLAGMDKVHEMGLLAIPKSLELMGVMAYANYAVFIGAAVWWTSGRPGYFLIQLSCLLGQGGSAALGRAFSYGSNFFEVVTFAGMVYADVCFFQIPGNTFSGLVS